MAFDEWSYCVCSEIPTLFSSRKKIKQVNGCFTPQRFYTYGGLFIAFLEQVFFHFSFSFFYLEKCNVLHVCHAILQSFQEGRSNDYFLFFLLDL